MPDGRLDRYSLSGGTWHPPTGIFNTLIDNGDGSFSAGIASPPDPGVDTIVTTVHAGGQEVVLTQQPVMTFVICGDTNPDDVVNILDIVFLIIYLYLEGPPPVPDDVSDVNGDGITNILDVTYLISYVYLSGPAPDCQ